MRHLTNTPGSTLTLLTIVLYLSYFLSSAPRYTRQVRNNDDAMKTSVRSVASQTLQSIRTYALEPNRRVWKDYSRALSEGWASAREQSYRSVNLPDFSFVRRTFARIPFFYWR